MARRRQRKRSYEEDEDQAQTFGVVLYADAVAKMTEGQLQQHQALARRELSRPEDWRPAAVMVAGIVEACRTAGDSAN